MSNGLKDYLKAKLDINDDIDLHLEQIAEKYASDICVKKGRYWSPARVVNSTDGLDPEFKLENFKLRNMISNDVMYGDDFCISEDHEKRNILAYTCKYV